MATSPVELATWLVYEDGAAEEYTRQLRHSQSFTLALTSPRHGQHLRLAPLPIGRYGDAADAADAADVLATELALQPQMMLPSGDLSAAIGDMCAYVHLQSNHALVGARCFQGADGEMLRLNITYGSLHRAMGATDKTCDSADEACAATPAAVHGVRLDVTLTARPLPLNWWAQTETGGGTPPMLSHTLTVQLDAGETDASSGDINAMPAGRLLTEAMVAADKSVLRDNSKRLVVMICHYSDDISWTEQQVGVHHD
jgi:hypothetical protein